MEAVVVAVPVGAGGGGPDLKVHDLAGTADGSGAPAAGYTVTQPSAASPFRTVTLGNGATAAVQNFGIQKVS